MTGIHLRMQEAEGLGYGRLTIPYRLPVEKPMLDNVRADMRAGSIKHALVIVPGGVEVWRASIKRTNNSGG